LTGTCGLTAAARTFGVVVSRMEEAKRMRRAVAGSTEFAAPPHASLLPAPTDRLDLQTLPRQRSFRSTPSTPPTTRK
jgi:hypothetical protein